MRRSNTRRFVSLLLPAVALLLGPRLSMAANPKDQPIETGPDIVILRELENAYEPVPFDHRTHAKMAQMWNGCTTCHHRPPQHSQSADQATTLPVIPTHRTQDEAAEIPACKSCHPITAVEPSIHMPSLKGAYHRQCLNCHKEWMHENACVICHQPKKGQQTPEAEPAPDDIVGRMHPPIPEPDVVEYKMRYTPADGGHVLFRHHEHTAGFRIRCVDCHYQDNCSHCHGPTGDTTAQKPLRPGMTWEESHGPCMGCHNQSRCRHCHYRDGESPLDPFNHVDTGQALDDDHAKLACSQCHENLAFEVSPTCGDAACHKGEQINFPSQLPGPVADLLPGPSAADAESTATAKNSPGNNRR